MSSLMYFDLLQGAIVAALSSHSHSFTVRCAGAGAVLRAGLIPSLVLKLKTELDEIQELILDTLSNCLRVEVSEALEAGVISVLKEKLSHPSTAIRSKAAWVLLEIR